MVSKNLLSYSKEIIKESPLQEIGTDENLTNVINILVTANDDRTCS